MDKASVAILVMFLSMIIAGTLVGNAINVARTDSKEARASIVESRKMIEKNKWFDNESKLQTVKEGKKLTYTEFYEQKMAVAIKEASVVAKICNQSKATCGTITDKHYYYLNLYKGDHFTKPKLPSFTAQDIYGFHTQERIRRVKLAVDKCNSDLMDECEVLLLTTL